MKIKVTEKHIKEGTSHCEQSDRCVLALAIREATGSPAIVGVTRWHVWNRGDNQSGDMPPETITFQKRLFKDLPVKPFTFEIDYEKRRTNKQKDRTNKLAGKSKVQGSGRKPKKGAVQRNRSFSGRSLRSLSLVPPDTFYLRRKGTSGSMD